MIINGHEYRTIWMENDVIFTIEQNKLPERFEIIEIHTIEEVCHAIETMIIRGAPAIGAMGAFGLAQAIQTLEYPSHSEIKIFSEQILKTRPTAYDLQHGLDHVYFAVSKESGLKELQETAIRSAQEYVDNSVEACRKIGEYGNELIKDKVGILTHCNAGALATVDHGTALSPMRIAHNQGKKIFVYVDETRPRLQGAKLTAFELDQEGIEHAVIVDNAAGHFMKNGDIQLVITGTDRVAANGDVANKIGTYEKAVVAHANGIPVYIAAPLSTIDFSCPTGDDIPIEEREPNEVTELNGQKLVSDGSSALNPAFDVTPNRYITGIITEKGIFAPSELHTLKDQ